MQFKSNKFGAHTLQKADIQTVNNSLIGSDPLVEMKQ